MMIVLALVAAQTIAFVVPLPPAWGATEVSQIVETDGRASTTEVVVRSLETWASRVVQVQPDGTWCAGPWFYWADDPYAWVQFRTVDGRTRAFVSIANHYIEITIETPRCP